MTPAIRLTERERAKTLTDALEQRRKEWDWLTEVITEADNFLGTMLQNAYIQRDWIRFGEVMEQLDRQYFERCNLAEQAVNEAERLKSIEHGG